MNLSFVAIIKPNNREIAVIDSSLGYFKANEGAEVDSYDITLNAEAIEEDWRNPCF